VELADGVGDGVVATTVVGRGVALAEVVGLDLGVVAADPLPVDLIEVVGLEDDAGDDTRTGGGLDLTVELAEEDVVVRGLGGGLLLVGDGEDGALLAVVLDGGAGEGVEVLVTLGLGEVDGDGLAEGGGVRALWEKSSVSLPSGLLLLPLPLRRSVGPSESAARPSRLVRGRLYSLFLRGSQSVCVWAVTRVEAARARMRDLLNILAERLIIRRK
jgi:hypothetical protein